LLSRLPPHEQQDEEDQNRKGKKHLTPANESRDGLGALAIEDEGCPVTRVAERRAGMKKLELRQPQGLGFDSAGNVLVSETAAGRLDVFIRTFKLVPVGGTPAPGQPVCLTVFRAPGFTGDIQLTTESGVEVVRQPGPGTTGEVLIQPSAGCSKVGCVVTATSGALADSLWITG